MSPEQVDHASSHQLVRSHMSRPARWVCRRCDAAVTLTPGGDFVGDAVDRRCAGRPPADRAAP